MDDNRTPQDKAKAFDLLLDATRTILTIELGIVAILAGFLSQRPDLALWSYSLIVISLLFLLFSIFCCLFVFLRAINVVDVGQADIRTLEFRTAYTLILCSFFVGLVLALIGVVTLTDRAKLPASAAQSKPLP
jgi:hypothetical protein